MEVCQFDFGKKSNEPTNKNLHVFYCDDVILRANEENQSQIKENPSQIKENITQIKDDSCIDKDDSNKIEENSCKNKENICENTSNGKLIWQEEDELSCRCSFPKDVILISCTIESLPDEMLVEIFTYLDRRERLACSLVSGRWQRALDCQSLWEYMTVSLDTDLMEPSTMLLTRQYHVHIKHLKLTWSSPELPARWIAYKVQDIVKRACRYVIILKEALVQLKSFNLNNWYEICRFKKLMYLLSQFLRIQTSLQSISFCNAQLHKKDFVKLLISCRSCECTIKHINTHNSFYDINESILSAQLITCMETFQNLNSLTIDYSTLCIEIIMSLLKMKNNSLELLEIYVQDKEMDKSVTEECWQMLKIKYPKLKVTLYLNYVNSTEFDCVFKTEIPLTNLYVYFSTKSSNKSCKDILRLICRNYKNSLEIIRLDIVNVKYVNDIILVLLNKCTKLRILELYGANYNLFRDMLHEQFQRDCTNVKYVHFLSTNVLLDDGRTKTLCTIYH